MTRFHDAISPALPEDGTAGALAGRVWRPDLGGPSVVAIRDGGVSTSPADFPPCATCARRPIRPRPCAPPPARNLGPLDAMLANTPPETRDPARPWLLAPIDLQAVKAAGVTFADLHAGAGDRGARPRRPRRRRRRSAPRCRRWSATIWRRLKPGSPEASRAEAGADRAGRLEPVSGSRHRPGRRDLHQVPADGRRRHRHGCRRASRSVLEQPGARGGAGRRLHRRGSSAPRWATTSTCAMSRAARRCCWARRRTTTPPARSGRSCGCSMPSSAWTMSARPRSPCVVEGTGGFPSGGLVLDRADQPRSGGPRRRRWSTRTTAIRTARCCSWAPCSRRSRIATRRARASPTRPATSSRSPRRKLGRLVNRIRPTDQCAPLAFGAGALMRNLAAAGADLSMSDTSNSLADEFLTLHEFVKAARRI